MPGQLRVDFAGAQEIAKALSTAATQNQNDLHTLSSKARPDQVWAGAAAAAYQNAYDRWESAEKQLIQALDDMGRAVKTIIDNFDHIDSQGASAFPG
jgi:WXG100 family type VII secretion target